MTVSIFESSKLNCKCRVVTYVLFNLNNTASSYILTLAAFHLRVCVFDIYLKWQIFCSYIYELYILDTAFKLILPCCGNMYNATKHCFFKLRSGRISQTSGATMTCITAKKYVVVLTS